VVQQRLKLLYLHFVLLLPRTGLTQEKQKLCDEIFNKEITLENLEKYWSQEVSK
jgi:hypothetical protein